MVKASPSSSDDEAYEVIGSQLPRENDESIVQEENRASLQDGPHDTNEPVVLVNESIAVKTAEPKEVNNDRMYRLVEENRRYQQNIITKEAQLAVMTELYGEKEAEVKKYADVVAKWRKEIESEMGARDKFFFISLIDLILALGIALFAFSKAWCVLALLLTVKGVIITRYVEMSKKGHKGTKWWREETSESTEREEGRAEEGFSPSISPTSDLDETAPLQLNREDIAIPMNDLSVHLSTGHKGSFGFFFLGTSIVCVRSGSPAAVRGVRRGDQILSIDGVIVENLSRGEISQLIERARCTGSIALRLRYNPDLMKEIETAIFRYSVVTLVASVTFLLSAYKLL